MARSLRSILLFDRWHNRSGNKLQTPWQAKLCTWLLYSMASSMLGSWTMRSPLKFSSYRRCQSFDRTAPAMNGTSLVGMPPQLVLWWLKKSTATHSHSFCCAEWPARRSSRSYELGVQQLLAR
jgi:hypothetical protein